jgi:hypothetical protein
MHAHVPYPIQRENATPPALTRAPYPTLDPHRLAQVRDQTLHSLIVLHRAGDVARDRLDAAGIPPLNALEAECQRRGTRWAVAS